MMIEWPTLSSAAGLFDKPGLGFDDDRAVNGQELRGSEGGDRTLQVHDGRKESSRGDDLAALKGVIQYPSRIKCATLAWTAFQQGLEEVDKGDGS